MRHCSRRSANPCASSGYRSGMSAAQRRRSVCPEKRYRTRFLRFALPKLLYVLSPFYHPRAKRAPRGAAQLLDEISPAA